MFIRRITVNLHHNMHRPIYAGAVYHEGPAAVNGRKFERFLFGTMTCVLAHIYF